MMLQNADARCFKYSSKGLFEKVETLFHMQFHVLNNVQWEMSCQQLLYIVTETEETENDYEQQHVYKVHTVLYTSIEIQ